MKSITIVAIIFFLVGCQNSPSSKNVSEITNGNREIISEMFYNKLKKNGPNLLCRQPVYNACYKTTELECFNEVYAFNEYCLDFSTERKGVLTSGGNMREYTGLYVHCLGLKHLASRRGEIKEISECLKGMKLDQKKTIGFFFE